MRPTYEVKVVFFEKRFKNPFAVSYTNSTLEVELPSLLFVARIRPQQISNYFIILNF